MNLRIFFVALFLLAAVRSAHAAFPVKKLGASTTTSVAVINAATQHPVLRHPGFMPETRSKLRMLFNPTGPRPVSGWPGITSFVCGVLGLALPVIFCLPAIVFGIIGLGRRYSDHGLAIAGLVLGLLELLAVIILLIIIASIVAFI